MTPSRGIRRKLATILFLSATFWTTNAASSNYCSVTLPCHGCTETDKKTEKECLMTGKIQEVTCEDDEEEGKSHISYESCKRTEADDEFLLVRLQMFCLTIGTLAFVSVRKQRYLSANLFDRRKNPDGSSNGVPNRVAPKPSRSSMSDIELMAQSRSQETVPLTENNSMAIV